MVIAPAGLRGETAVKIAQLVPKYISKKQFLGYSIDVTIEEQTNRPPIHYETEVEATSISATCSLGGRSNGVREALCIL